MILILLLDSVFIEVKAMDKFLNLTGFTALSAIAAGGMLIANIFKTSQNEAIKQEEAALIALEQASQNRWIPDDEFQKTKDEVLSKLGLKKLE
jgi:hypothetical protein